ncbi:MAG: cupin domain-containing protein [Acidobacteria bacterium]|nr:cupin domain-containing protein [Acidobacteriota bacterium]
MPQKTSWEKVDREQMGPAIVRQMINGANLTVAQFSLTRGAIVPRHFHINEQITYVVKGTLKLTFDSGNVVLHSGEVIVIPANEAHAAEAVQDCQVLDGFAPRREDWVNKDDAYLRK